MRGLKNKSIIIFLVLAVIITIYLDSVVCLIKRIFPLSSIPGIVTLSDRVLFITFLALVWYAWETQKIREIEEKPIIDLYYKPRTTEHEKYLGLRNSGKGVAYNIEIESIKEDDKTFEFYFEDPNLILMPDKEQTLHINTKYKEKGGSWKRDEIDPFLDYVTEETINNKNKDKPNLLREEQKVRINIFYENALKKKFRRKFYIYNRNQAGIDELYKKDLEVKFEKET